MQSSKMDICQKYVVTGRVQGVFYRQSTQQKATELALVGWVQNLSNGDVVVYVKGQADILSQFENWLKVGPPAAKVAELFSAELTQEERVQLNLVNNFRVVR